ncbi:MAG: hypothetical protein AAGB05_01515 [Pseudomonadota bacterium]
MSSSTQSKRREAKGQTLFLWLKILAMLGFFGAIFALGANPFTGELPTAEPEVEQPQ